MSKKHFLEGSEPQPHEEVRLLQMHLRRKEEELDRAKKTILAMESSKFWRLRVLWLKVKSLDSFQSKYFIIKAIFLRIRKTTLVVDKIKKKFLKSFFLPYQGFQILRSNL